MTSNNYSIGYALFFYTIYYLVQAENTNCDDNQPNVIKYAIIFRHGAREKVGNNFELAQLLNEGKQQGYNRGVWLRRRYQDVLENNYKNNEIYCYSSDVDRVLMTSEAVLAGLYHPLSFKDRWTMNLEWIPIPVHTSEKQYDSVMYQERQKYCPRMGKLYAQKVKYLKEKYPEIMDFYMREKNLTFEEQGDIYQLIRTLDENIQYFNETVEQEFNYDINLLFQDPEWLKFEVGPKFGKIIEQWEQENRKAVLLGGHDISIWHCIYALGFEQPENIGFISSIIFELHSVKNATSENLFVKVIFKNGPEAENEVKSIKGCTELCPYNQFIKILSDIVPKNWNNECEIGCLNSIR